MYKRLVSNSVLSQSKKKANKIEKFDKIILRKTWMVLTMKTKQTRIFLTSLKITYVSLLVLNKSEDRLDVCIGKSIKVK